MDWELFQTKLNEYAERIKETKPNLFFILTTCEIENSENNSATITFSNSMQEKEFELSRQEIVKTIREETKCSVFIFKSKTIQEEIKEKLYRPVDKFNFLAEKAPAILKLRAEFDIELDY